MAIFTIEKPPLVVPGTVGWFSGPDTASGVVSSWTNFANSRATASAAGSARPTATANQQNGLTGLVFDGVANLLTLSSMFFSLPNAANSILIVAKRNVASGNQQLINMNIGAAPTNDSYKVQYANTAGNILFQNKSLNTSAAISTGNTTTNFNIIQGDFDGSTVQNIRINNGTVTTNSNGLPVSGIDGGAIGGQDEGTQLLSGVIMEIIMSNIQWTTSQRTYLTKYLSNRYGIAIS